MFLRSTVPSLPNQPVDTISLIARHSPAMLLKVRDQKHSSAIKLALAFLALDSHRFEPYQPASFLVQTDYVVCCSGIAVLYLEDNSVAISSLFHCTYNSLVLMSRIEVGFGLSHSLSIVPDQFFELIYNPIAQNSGGRRDK